MQKRRIRVDQDSLFAPKNTIPYYSEKSDIAGLLVHAKTLIITALSI